jgi:hypothetical protein
MTKETILDWAAGHPVEFDEISNILAERKKDIRTNFQSGAIFEAYFGNTLTRFVVAILGPECALLGLFGDSFSAWCCEENRYVTTPEKAIAYLEKYKAVYKGKHL